LSALTPMFEKTKIFTLDDHVKSAERKTRSDKKKQVKVPVTDEQKLEIGKLSLSNGHKGEIDSYLAMVFKQATERNYLIYSKPVEYKDTGIYVSTKVKMDIYDEIIRLKVEWGLRSIKQAAHRILINELLG
jgi:hypothetical protein